MQEILASPAGRFTILSFFALEIWVTEQAWVQYDLILAKFFFFFARPIHTHYDWITSANKCFVINYGEADYIHVLYYIWQDTAGSLE